eukprot:862297-Rhodomonas_salina.1
MPYLGLPHNPQPATPNLSALSPQHSALSPPNPPSPTNTHAPALKRGTGGAGDTGVSVPRGSAVRAAADP